MIRRNFYSSIVCALRDDLTQTEPLIIFFSFSAYAWINSLLLLYTSWRFCCFLIDEISDFGRNEWRLLNNRDSRVRLWIDFLINKNSYRNHIRRHRQRRTKNTFLGKVWDLIGHCNPILQESRVGCALAKVDTRDGARRRENIHPKVNLTSETSAKLGNRRRC